MTNLRLVLAVALTVLTAVLLPSTAAAKTVTVGGKSAGKLLKLKRGDTLKVRLTENPSTGFAWKLTTKPAKAVLKGKGRKFDAPEQNEDMPSVGAPGKVIFTWNAVGTGTTSLKLKNFPPGQGRKAERTLTFRVRVGA